MDRPFPRGGGGGGGGDDDDRTPSSTSSSGERQLRRRRQAAISSRSSSAPRDDGVGEDRRPSPFEYVPVTALDDYGRSTQLRHAMESASRHGTPVLACICRIRRRDDGKDDDNDDEDAVEDAIVVCSLQRPRPGVISDGPPTGATGVGGGVGGAVPIPPSVRGMVRTLATEDDDDSHVSGHALRAAIAITGMRSDADYLSDRIRAHLNRHWFRYDSLPRGGGMVKMAGDVLLDCLGYDRDGEACGGRASGGIGSAAPSGGGDDDDEDGGGDGAQRAGRPLGVCAFLLGLDDGPSPPSSSSRGRRRRHRRPPFLTVIEANGASQRYVARAMGIGSDFANEELSRKWRRRMGQREAVDMMRGILGGIARERGWLLLAEEEEGEMDGGDGVCIGGGDGELFTVVCETVTSRGIDIQFVTL